MSNYLLVCFKHFHIILLFLFSLHPDLFSQGPHGASGEPGPPGRPGRRVSCEGQVDGDQMWRPNIALMAGKRTASLRGLFFLQ